MAQQQQSLCSPGRARLVRNLRASCGAQPSPRASVLASSPLLSGGDVVASTSSLSSAGGHCGPEFFVAKGFRRPSRFVCSARNGGRNGEDKKEPKKRAGLEGARYEWKWHEKRGPPPLWNRGPSIMNRRQSQTRHGEPSSEFWDCKESADVPAPANLPAGDAGGMASGGAGLNDGYASPEEEFQRFAKNIPKRDKSGVDLIQEMDTYCRLLPEVYVVLFGVGETTTEGIYSLRSHSEVTGLHVETIICFENSEDAFRFASLLEATMTHGPSVHTIRPNDLVKFCEDSGYQCRLELSGSMMMPPEFNVGITDWERSLRLREGRYKVLQQEPEVEHQALAGWSMDDIANHEAPEPVRSSFDEARQRVEMSDSIAMELDEVRAMLEGLLPDN